MAFEGSLREFSLADVFRLIAAGKKTGVLTLDRDAWPGRVHFRDGRVVFATSTANRGPLGGRLVRARVITEEELELALEIQRVENADGVGRRLGEILVDAGAVQRAVVEDFLREQIADTLCELFRWEEGWMSFETDEADVDQDCGFSATVESVIAETNRRLEQFDEIGLHIASSRARFVMSAAPAERTSEIHLQPSQWTLLRHMHVGRGVRDLAEATGGSYVGTAQALFGMIEVGLVEQYEVADSANDADADDAAEHAVVHELDAPTAAEAVAS